MTQHAIEHLPEEIIRPWAECWQVVRGASTLTFSLYHIVFQQISGQFRRWGGRLILDRDQPSRSQLNVWIDLASVDTGQSLEVVSVALVDAEVGDTILVHAKEAIAVVRAEAN